MQTVANQLVIISDKQSQQRIDNYLRTQLKGVPKSLVYRILRQGQVRVNKKRIKPDYKLQPLDEVRIPPVRVANTLRMPVPVVLHKVQALSECLLYEDDGLLVLNKPSGMAVHGGSGISFGIIEGLRALRPELSFLELVHRLDRETSGVLVVAKKRSVLRALHEQLRLHQIKKHYIALVHGQWPLAQTRVSAPLLKKVLASGERIMHIHPLGKPSETRFSVIEHFAQLTLMKVYPITGRTHQIRVHCQSIGYPIVFDGRYGNNAWDQQLVQRGLRLTRLFLHAAAIDFTHPQSGQRLLVQAPLVQGLQQVLYTLRTES